jgi:hypothetical protein
MKEPKQEINRRQFLQQGTRGASLLAVGSATWAGAMQWSRAAGAEKATNPFGYEVERYTKTDPKLLHYEQIARFACASPGPRRLAIGPEDHLAIATRSGVSVFDQTGTRLSEIACKGPVRCVAVAGDGTIYAGLRDHVEVFDRKGQSLAAWEAPDPKTWLTGLTLGENSLFAADSGNRVILRYDKSGKLLGRIGEKNLEHNAPGLIVPSPYLDVKLARDGLLRVNNPGRHRVEIYGLDGALELAWGKPSAAVEGFCGCCNPIGLALLPDGRCVTCEKGFPRVKVHSAQGEFACVVAGPESFPENVKAGSARDPSDGTMGGLDAAVDSQGRVYILDLIAGDVRVMKPKA